MRNHFEDSALDFRYDVGGGAFEAPVRFRPLTWTYANSQYVNERPIGTMQTGWNFVATLRSAMPEPLKGVLWFGVDDSATTVRVPIYGAATRVPPSFAGQGPQDGLVSPMMKYDDSHAFWAFNLVANWAYARWSDVYPVVLPRIEALEQAFADDVRLLDAKATAALAGGADEAAVVELVTQWGVEAGDALTSNWRQFFGELFVRFRDGYDITPNPASAACGCAVASPGKGYSANTYARIVAETGSQYFEKSLGAQQPTLTSKNDSLSPVNKLTLKQV